MKGEEFVSVGQSQLIELISSDDLECDREEDVFTAVMRWLSWSRETRETEFHRVLAHVRLPLLSPYFLHDCVEKERCVKWATSYLRTYISTSYPHFPAGYSSPKNVFA